MAIVPTVLFGFAVKTLRNGRVAEGREPGGGVAAVGNMFQSVLDRLKSRARRSGMSLQLVLQLFCQGEFLRRLAVSRYR